MDQGREWSARMTAVVGKRVAHYRRQQGRSAQDVALRCAELGYPSLSRVVITKLENGRRESVSVAEIQVLGQALEVPPILLLFPLSAERVEVLPGLDVAPWDAIQWFRGRSGDPGNAGAAPQTENGGANPVVLYEDHQVLVSSMDLLVNWNLRTIRQLAEAGVSGEKEYEEALRDRGRQMLAQADLLYRIRAAMRNLGVIPPEVTAALAGLLSLEASPRDGDMAGRYGQWIHEHGFPAGESDGQH